LCLDLDDQQLDEHSLLEAALIVAGHDRTTVLQYMGILAESTARCAVKLGPNDSHQSKLQTIFQHLATEFLRGEYRPNLHDVGRTVSDQSFNCLTATILFQSLCKSFSIEIDAVWEPSHVKCWSRTGIMIETTAASAEFATTPKSLDQLTGRRLSSPELLAKVFYNRGVSALQDERFSAALSSTWCSCLLDPLDSSAQANLRACLNNWALSALQQDNLALAKELLKEGLQLDPHYEPFSRNLALLLGPDPRRP
jgi:tetratricopeptide (TPR) repeat protein